MSQFPQVTEITWISHEISDERSVKIDDTLKIQQTAVTICTQSINIGTDRVLKFSASYFVWREKARLFCWQKFSLHSGRKHFWHDPVVWVFCGTKGSSSNFRFLSDPLFAFRKFMWTSSEQSIPGFSARDVFDEVSLFCDFVSNWTFTHTNCTLHPSRPTFSVDLFFSKILSDKTSFCFGISPHSTNFLVPPNCGFQQRELKLQAFLLKQITAVLLLLDFGFFVVWRTHRSSLKLDLSQFVWCLSPYLHWWHVLKQHGTLWWIQFIDNKGVHALGWCLSYHGWRWLSFCRSPPLGVFSCLFHVHDRPCL